MLISAAIALYAIWTAATYLLEGRRETLLKPAASTDRIVYAVVANMLVGTVGSLLVIRWSLAGEVPAWPGFRSPPVTVLWVAIGLVLGTALLAIQRPATWDRVVLLNGYAQTLVVSIAEVLVCWAVLGSAVSSSVPDLGTIASIAMGLVGASVAFGAYHFAHTAPFNSVRLVVGLSVVGLATGLFFLVSRDIYGTIAFHSFLALKGVTDALSKQGLLDRFRRWQPALIGMAAAAVALLVACDALLIR